MMKILLVDNTKENLFEYTRLLEERLLCFTEDLVVCNDLEKINCAFSQNFDAIILSGSSLNLSQPNKMHYFSKSLSILLRYPDTPVLGICFGMQLIVACYGGNISRLEINKEEECAIQVKENSVLFGGTPVCCNVTLSHQDFVISVPPDFSVYSKKDETIQVVESLKYLRFGVQFHPEKRVKNEQHCVLTNFFSFLKEKNHIPKYLSLDSYYTRIFLIKNSGRIIIDKRKETIVDKIFWTKMWNQHRMYWNIQALLIC